MMAATLDRGDGYCTAVARPFEQALREDLAPYANHTCCECMYTRAIWSSLDKNDGLPLCDGCYNEDQLACVKELLAPSVADIADGIPATVYMVYTNQPACFDFERRRR